MIEVFWDRGVNFKSDVLKFFEDERDGQINISSTYKRNKNGNYIFHVSFLWYSPSIGGGVQQEFIGKFEMAPETWRDVEDKRTSAFRFYKEQVEQIAIKAEQNYTRLFKIVLDKVFNNKLD